MGLFSVTQISLEREREREKILQKLRWHDLIGVSKSSKRNSLSLKWIHFNDFMVQNKYYKFKSVFKYYISNAVCDVVI